MNTSENFNPDDSSDLFCVWAYRFGQTNGYNFPVGLFETLKKAQTAAQSHREYRGGKYGHLIYKIPLGVEFDAEECKPVLNLLS